MNHTYKIDNSDSEESLKEIKYFTLKQAPLTKSAQLEITRQQPSGVLNIYKQPPNISKSDIQAPNRQNAYNIQTYEYGARTMMVLDISQKLSMKDDFYKPIYFKQKKTLKQDGKPYTSQHRNTPKRIEIDRMKHVADHIHIDEKDKNINLFT